MRLIQESLTVLMRIFQLHPGKQHGKQHQVGEDNHRYTDAGCNRQFLDDTDGDEQDGQESDGV